MVKQRKAAALCIFNRITQLLTDIPGNFQPV